MSIYMSKIKDIAIKNKYTKWYCEIITNGLNRVDSTKTKHAQRREANGTLGLVEGHHILPRCMCVDDFQIKDKLNIAYLTPREHVIAHMLLAKMFHGDTKKKMVWAAHRMINRCTNSNTYAYIRNIHAKQSKERIYTLEERTSRSVTAKANWNGNDERRKHASENFSRFRKDGTVKTKTEFSDEDRQMFSAIATAHWDGNDERRIQTSESTKKYHSENPDMSRNMMNELHSNGTMNLAYERYWTDENKQKRSAQTKSHWDNQEWKEQQLKNRKHRIENKETVLYAILDMIVVEFKTIAEARDFIIAPRTGTFSKLLKSTEPGNEFTHKGVLFYVPY